MTELVLKKSIDCKQGSVRAVRYNVDGSYCLSCGSDKKLKLWNPHTGLLLKTYGGHADEVTDAAGSADSCYIISSSLDKSVIYWDVTTGQSLRRLRYHAGGVTCTRFNQNSSIVVSGSIDNSVMCWDVRSRRQEPIQIMKDAKDTITAVAVTEKKIITSSLDGCVRQYDLRAGELTTDDITEPITFIAHTKDEQCVLAACIDGVVRLVDLVTSSILAEYKGHKTEDYHIECGVFSNEVQVISGSSEGYAIIWDLMDSKEVLKLQLDSGIVHSLATHPSEAEVVLANKREIHMFGVSDIDNEV